MKQLRIRKPRPRTAEEPAGPPTTDTRIARLWFGGES